MNRLSFLLPVILLAGPAPGADPVGSGAEAPLLEGVAATDAAYLAMDAIPRAVFADQPDSLLLWINAWEDAGGPAGLLWRLRALGAIWDGAFTEALYPDDILDLLVAESLGEGVPALATGNLSDRMQRALARGDSPPTASVRRRFTSFLISFADQMLPHVAPASPAAFFCLFETDRPAAWALLQSDALKGTRLKNMRDRRVRDLESVLPTFVAVEGGRWSAFNRYAFAGEHALLGLQVGARRGPWLGRLVLETRLGRTERGYLARQGDILGVSDRFDAMLVGLELGRSLRLADRWSLEGFAGVGFDGVKPLKDEDIVLGALHLDLGTGLRWTIDPRRRWFVGATVRREWIRPRNQEGTALWGDAWSLRLAVGFNLEAQTSAELALMKP